MPLLLIAACVGDNPTLESATTVDAGEDRTSPAGDSGASPPDAAPAGDAGGDANQEAGPPACSLIQVTTLTGTGAPGLTEGPGATAKFDGAEGITVGPDGTLFVADSNNKRVRKVLSDGTTSTYASGASILSAYRLGYRSGDIYLIDRTNDALLRIVAGAPPTISTILQIGALAAVGTSPSGSIYVTQTQNCYLSKVTGNTSARFSGDSVACGFADGSAAAARFSLSVLDIGFDGANAMYVVDAGNYRIRQVRETDGFVSTLAGSTMGHADGTGSAAQFEAPTGLAVDPQTHTVYVADKTTIRAVTPAGVVTTLVGTTAGFDDGSGCTAKFGELHGITYYAGALYAVDVNRVRKVKLP